MTEQPQSPRQTLSYLTSLLRDHGIRPKNKLGQNFLIDLNLVDVIVSAAELTRDDLVIEVGTGTGGLTAKLVEHAGAVLSVEIDPAFHSLAKETLRESERLVLLNFDILRSKNELNPGVLEAIRNLMESTGLKRLKLVANLPYAVATPVISNFLLTDLPIERMVVMVQLEIGERLIATPSTKSYGALAVMVQSLADVEILRRLPPAVFYPRPEVDSAIVRIRPNAEKRARVGDVRRLRNFLRDLYTHRRKNLRGAILGFHGHPFSKPEVDAKLAELGIDVTVRAEALDLEQHHRLCLVFGTEPSQNPSQNPKAEIRNPKEDNRQEDI
jgi:16S rRNA (adenine1518-N6/adenine1519-N6)-dimethyltransferase